MTITIIQLLEKTTMPLCNFTLCILVGIKMRFLYGSMKLKKCARVFSFESYNIIFFLLTCKHVELENYVPLYNFTLCILVGVKMRFLC
jgi:hypothetical protein